MRNLTDAIDYGLSKGCNDIELYIEKSEELNVEIRSGAIDKYQESKSQGIGVRVIKASLMSLELVTVNLAFGLSVIFSSDKSPSCSAEIVS